MASEDAVFLCFLSLVVRREGRGGGESVGVSADSLSSFPFLSSSDPPILRAPC